VRRRWRTGSSAPKSKLVRSFEEVAGKPVDDGSALNSGWFWSINDFQTRRRAKLLRENIRLFVAHERLSDELGEKVARKMGTRFERHEWASDLRRWRLKKTRLYSHIVGAY
jgi:hypothetical protein